MSAHLIRAIRNYRARTRILHDMAIVGSVASGGALVLAVEAMLIDPSMPCPATATLLIAVAIGPVLPMWYVGRRAEAALEKETGYSSLSLLLDAEGGEA